MSKDPLAAKIAEPYARALYDFSIQGNVMHEITADFRNNPIIEQTDITPSC